MLTVNTVKDGSPRALLGDLSKILSDIWFNDMRGSEEKGYGAEEPLLQWRSYLQHGLAGLLIGHDWCSASHDLKPVSLNK